MQDILRYSYIFLSTLLKFYSEVYNEISQPSDDDQKSKKKKKKKKKERRKLAVEQTKPIYSAGKKKTSYASVLEWRNSKWKPKNFYSACTR
jgi:hypothetical protein